MLSDDAEPTNELNTLNKEPVQKTKIVIENNKDLIAKEAINLVLEIEALPKILENKVKLSVGQVKKFFRSLQSYFEIGNCSCHSYTCGCCIQPFIPEIHLDSKCKHIILDI